MGCYRAAGNFISEARRLVERTTPFASNAALTAENAWKALNRRGVVRDGVACALPCHSTDRNALLVNAVRRQLNTLVRMRLNIIRRMQKLMSKK